MNLPRRSAKLNEWMTGCRSVTSKPADKMRWRCGFRLGGTSGISTTLNDAQALQEGDR